MRDGEFEFSEGPPTLEPRADLSADPLAQLTQMAASPPPPWVSRVPGPTAVPHLIVSTELDDTEVAIPRAALSVLMDIDGRSTVRDIAARRGLLRSLKALGVLCELGVLEFEAGAAPPLPGTGGQVLVVNRLAYVHLDNARLARIFPTTRQGSTTYLFGGPQRGEVAVFRAPPEPDTDYIKRIIGLPGDTVAVQNGRVFVNGAPLVEPYVEFPADYSFPGNGDGLVVPDGNYFVLGDNRPESLDSHFGWFVPVQDLIGRAWLRYWPPGELGLVQTPPNAEPRDASTTRPVQATGSSF